MSESTSTSTSIEHTSDECLVLFEFLQRFSESEALTIQDQAEERALWNLCCLLEKKLSAPFASNYQDQLDQARARLRDERQN